MTITIAEELSAPVPNVVAARYFEFEVLLNIERHAVDDGLDSISYGRRLRT